MNNFYFIRGALDNFLSNPTWDLLLLLFFFAAVFIYGLVVGRNRIIVLLLASYPAVLINEYIPYSQFFARLNPEQGIFVRAFGFFILALLIFWIFGKAGFSRRELSKKTGQVLFLSFFNVGLWANVLFGYAMAARPAIIALAPLNQLLFGSDLVHLIWFALPILALYWFERG